jgi:hypothetical protein
MFNVLANAFQAGGVLPRTAVLEVHPGQLSRWLDELWGAGPAPIPLPGGGPASPPFLGAANIVPALDNPPAGAQSFTGNSGISVASTLQFTGLVGPLPPAWWHHLIYAYLLENTGVVEIFAEVIKRAAFGETLEIERNQAMLWLRTTEELFFKDPPYGSITGVTSQLRPEARIVRRNAYWRMFGLDLSHPLTARGMGSNGNGAHEWKQHTGNGVNTSFREKWAELLRQVWLGYENRNNAVGANATDNAYLQLLCDSLHDMLTMRRRGGFLAREEFASVALLNWFDLTLSEDTPIVQELKASATSSADRLTLVAQRVGMRPSPHARELFELAELMSGILRLIEADAFANPGLAATLYIPGTALSEIMNRIIDLWQSATGERVKERPIGNVVTAGTQQPLRIPPPQPVIAPQLVARTATGGRP